MAPSPKNPRPDENPYQSPAFQPPPQPEAIPGFEEPWPPWRFMLIVIAILASILVPGVLLRLFF